MIFFKLKERYEDIHTYILLPFYIYVHRIYMITFLILSYSYKIVDIDIIEPEI